MCYLLGIIMPVAIIIIIVIIISVVAPIILMLAHQFITFFRFIFLLPPPPFFYVFSASVVVSFASDHEYCAIIKQCTNSYDAWGGRVPLRKSTTQSFAAKSDVLLSKREDGEW